MTTAPLPKEMRTLLQPDIHSTKLILTTTPVPIPTHPDDVLVRVHACAPCAGELQWAANFPSAIPSTKDPVPAQDLAGHVVHAPAGSGFIPGDRVFCRLDAARPGAARDYALARVSELAKIPPGLDWVQAAAVPLSALTAWQALFEQGTLEAAGIAGDVDARKRNAGMRVLVTAAAGGVGSWVLQLAALAGAGAIVALAGPTKGDRVREYGATEVVDYTSTTLGEWVAEDSTRQVDLVVDGVGGATLAGCWATVKEGGTIVGINTPPDAVKPAGLDKSVAKALFFIVKPLGSQLADIAALLEAGRVRAVVDSVYDFDEFERAFERLEQGHGSGKIVIKVSDEA